MARVPFNTDNIKKEYLKNLARDEICLTCGYGYSQCDLKVLSINRNVVENVQDLFDATFVCHSNSQKKIVISKFFLPNSLFEKKYMEEIMKRAETEINITGKEVLDELLKWGRLEIIDD